QRGKTGIARIGNERTYVRVIYLDADRRRELASDQHVGHLLTWLDRNHVGGRLVFGHMLVARQHPGDFVEVDTMLLREHGAGPHPGRDRVATVDPDLSAFQVLGGADAGLDVVGDRTVMKGAYQKYRHGGERLTMSTCADIGRDRHLADVELVLPDHA